MNPDSTQPTVAQNHPKTISLKRKVVSVVAWIIGWPIIMGVTGILILAVVGNTIFNGEMMNSPQGSQIRAMWTGYVALLVVICFLFMWLTARKQGPLHTIRRRILRTYMWLGIIVGVGITVIIPDTQVATDNSGINVQQTDALFKPTIQHDPTISASLARVGAMDTEWINTKFVAEYTGELSDQSGEYQAIIDTVGNWSYGELTIKQGVTGDVLDTSVAHEYLHHVWFKTIDEPTKVKLTSDLVAMYGKDPAMQDRVQSYAEKQILQPTELFSYYCTETADASLTPYVLSICNTHINRAQLAYIQ